MAHLITANTCTDAWLKAAEYIIQNGNGFNLVVEIQNPVTIRDIDLINLNPHELDARLNDVKNVSKTIFPHRLWTREIDRQLLYTKHRDIYLRGKRITSNKSAWGNYFLRFTHFGLNQKNQLENIINRLSGNKRKFSAACIMHTNSVDTDNNTRIIGGPCLQYVQFSVDNTGNLNLTALYRNHDFLNKAFGNYIGLGKLLEFVSHETGRPAGILTCYSTHYYADNFRQLSALKNRYIP